MRTCSRFETIIYQKSHAIQRESEGRKAPHLHPSKAAPRSAYPLHAMVVLVVTGVVGREVEGRRGLSAGQGEVVLAAQLHLSHHLCL